LPDEFAGSLARHEEDANQQFEIGVEFATRQSAELIREGAPGIHYYVLNKADATSRILAQLALPGR
jgi:methylenetetrahydrofolate reductase (NADPH)